MDKVYKKNDDTVHTRCVAAINIWGITGNSHLINGVGVNFDNIGERIASCGCWIAFASKYLMYKITSITVTVSPIHDETTLINGASSVPVYIAIFPTLLNTLRSNTEITEKDDTFLAFPKVTSVQSHTFYFDDHYLESENGGFGIWLQNDFILTAPGQISFSNFPLGGTFEADKALYQVEYDFNISFRHRRV